MRNDQPAGQEQTIAWDEIDYQTYRRLRAEEIAKQERRRRSSPEFLKRSEAAKRGHQTRLQNRKLREWQIFKQTFVYNYCDKQGTK